MAEGIDRERGVQHHEHTKESAEQQRADATHPALVPPHAEGKGDGQSGYHDHPIVTVLPEDDGVAAQPDFVLVGAMGGFVKEPAAVAVPEASAGIVGIFIRIRASVMANVVGTPDECRVLQRPSPGNQCATLDPVRAFETLMGDQAVVPDGDPHAGHDIHDEGEDPIEGGEANKVPVQRNSNDGGGDDGAKQQEIDIRKTSVISGDGLIRCCHSSS